MAALGRDRYGEVNYIGKTQGCHGPVAVSTGDRYGEVTAKAGSTVLSGVQKQVGNTSQQKVDFTAFYIFDWTN